MGLEELVIPDRKELDGRMVLLVPRQGDSLAMQRLDSMLQGRTIGFREKVGPYLDDVVRPHSDKEAVEDRVMEPAERQAIADHRLAIGVSVRNDVCGVEELVVLQAAHSTLMPIRVKNPLAERSLM